MSQTATQEGWVAPRFADDVAEADRPAWDLATRKVIEVAEKYGWTKSEVARRADVPVGTFSQWFDGNYKGQIGKQTQRIERWLNALAEISEAVQAIPPPPEFVPTKSARELIDTLLYAQAMPEMVVVTYGAGMGKTITCEHYAKEHPHVYLVRMRPTTSRVHSMLQEIGLELGIAERNPARLDRAIGEKLRRNGRNTLLIIDEAQNLVDDAVNQARYFLDHYGCGIALVGNEELYTRFGGEKPLAGYAQIHRRIGRRLRRLQPLQEDIDALIVAWQIEDEDVRKLLRAVGRKPGALGQITKTMQLAGMLAAGDRKPVGSGHVRAAWSNRGGEEM